MTLSLIFPSPAKIEKLKPEKMLKSKKNDARDRSHPEARYFSPRNVIAISGPSEMNRIDTLKTRIEK